MKETEQTLLDQIKDQVSQELFKCQFGNLLYSEHEKAFINKICELYATAKAQASCEAKWISVKDHMPEPFVSVIVAGGIGFYTGSKWHTITGTAWPGVPIAWEVTHWQPVPKNPTLQ